jgi:predicted membrane protein
VKYRVTYVSLYRVGPTAMAPIQDALVTALAHSVSANLVHLNMATVERVRTLAIATYGIDRAELTKSAVLSALMDALEDTYVDTTHPAVVVFNDHPGWLLSNEATAEVSCQDPVLLVMHLLCAGCVTRYRKHYHHCACLVGVPVAVVSSVIGAAVIAFANAEKVFFPRYHGA